MSRGFLRNVFLIAANVVALDGMKQLSTEEKQAELLSDNGVTFQQSNWCSIPQFPGEPDQTRTFLQGHFWT
jgi:hypothetical protein